MSPGFCSHPYLDSGSLPPTTQTKWIKCLADFPKHLQGEQREAICLWKCEELCMETNKCLSCGMARTSEHVGSKFVSPEKERIKYSYYPTTSNMCLKFHSMYDSNTFYILLKALVATGVSRMGSQLRASSMQLSTSSTLETGLSVRPGTPQVPSELIRTSSFSSCRANETKEKAYWLQQKHQEVYQKHQKHKTCKSVRTPNVHVSISLLSGLRRSRMASL